MHITCKFISRTWRECRHAWQAKSSKALSRVAHSNELKFCVFYRSPEITPALTTSTIPPLGVRLADVTSTSTTSTAKSSCGRFQFQCQTSRECIAVRLLLSWDLWSWWWLMKVVINFPSPPPQIYNVCDQIAQCEDGSDEGPEVRKRTTKLFRNSTFFPFIISLSVPHPTASWHQKS